MALNNIPPLHAWMPGPVGIYDFLRASPRNYYLGALAVGVDLLRPDPAPGELARRPRHDRAARERAARGLGRRRRHALPGARRRSCRPRMAGAAGSLYAHYVRIVDPDVFLFIYTVTMVIMVITGGKGTLAGPIVGGVIFGFLPVILRALRSSPRCSGSSTAC